MRKFLLGEILVLAFLLRTVAISSYPVGFTPDEASFGYDAYSLLKTGKDQWGENWPLTFRSFGDFKLPLYTYLTIPSVAIFGLNEFATRLPNAVFGTLGILVTYLLALELFKKRELALFTALLLAISPWHVSLSRGAFEANLTTFFVPLGVWAFLRGLTKPRWMVMAALALGLNLFTYHSARLFTPLLVASLVWLNFSVLRRTVEKYTLSLIIFLAFLVVAAYSVFSGGGARGTDIAIFNPTDRWQAVAQRRYQTVLQGVPDEVARAFSNKLTYVWDQFIGGYVSYLSPQFLFTQGAGEWTYGMIPGRGVLYFIELPFILAALWYVTRNRSPLKFILIWILLSLIPAALTKGPGLAANRVAVMMPAIQILSAYGGVLLFNTLTKWINQGKLALFYSLAFLLSLGFFLEDYRYHAPINGAKDMLYGRGEAVEFVKSIENNYSEIIFSRSLSEPHIFVAFYNRWNPTDYQKQAQDWLRYQEEGRLFVDQLGEYRLGKYVFSDVNFEKYKTKSGILLVGKPNEFPQNIAVIKKVNYPGGEPAILIVDPTAQVYAKAF